MVSRLEQWHTAEILALVILLLPTLSLSICRDFCGYMPVKHPFGIDDGCGAPQFKKMLNCSTDGLFFETPSGNYKVQSIDYNKKTMAIYDPTMSTCSILQPRRDFTLSSLQRALIPPSSDTVFALINCSLFSPILNHYKPLCFNFSHHSCDDLYTSCTSFHPFHTLLSNTTTMPPPCCFTRYSTVAYMGMDVLDCTHYTSVYGVGRLEGVGPLDWTYGIELVYGVPDDGCGECVGSGGRCGFDVETEGMVCMCSSGMNATRECGIVTSDGKKHIQYLFLILIFLIRSIL